MCLQEMMPLQYLYTMALEQDIKNSLTSRKTSELIQARCYQVWIHSYIQKFEVSKLSLLLQRQSLVFNLVFLSQRPWLPRRMRLTSGAESLRSSGQGNKGEW